MRPALHKNDLATIKRYGHDAYTPVNVPVKKHCRSCAGCWNQNVQEILINSTASFPNTVSQKALVRENRARQETSITTRLWAGNTTNRGMKLVLTTLARVHYLSKRLYSRGATSIRHTVFSGVNVEHRYIRFYFLHGYLVYTAHSSSVYQPKPLQRVVDLNGAKECPLFCITASRRSP